MEKILIVDDLPKNIQVLGLILKDEGYNVAVARNGREAIDNALKTLPDLILLDIMMPEMDGFEACAILKKDDRTKEIPILFLSAKSESEDIVKGLGLGAADYIQKPFNKSELLARVKTHIALKKQSDQLVEQQKHMAEADQMELMFKTCGLVSHEINNPLTILMGSLELIKYNLQKLGKEDPKLAKKITNALDSAERIMDAISKIKKLSPEDIKSIDLEGKIGIDK